MKQQSYLIRICFTYIVLFIALDFVSNNLLNESIYGMLIIVICLINIIELAITNSLFSPRLFSSLFLLTYGLYELGLSTQIKGLTASAQILILFCMLSWDVICCTNPYNFIRIPEKRNIIFNLSIDRLKIVTVGIFIISAICMLYEWYRFGGVPALSQNLEITRFDISVNSYIHIVAVMQRIVAVFTVIYLIKRRSVLMCVILVCSLLLLLGLGARAELLYPILISLIIGYNYYFFPKRKLLIWGIIVFIIIGVVPLIRHYISFGSSYISDLRSISRYPSLYFLTPLYESFAYNLEIFQVDFSSFPKLLPYGFGTYTVLPNIPFVHLGQSITDVQNYLLGNNFYAGLASTYLGSVYADYGFIGSIVFTIVMSFVVNHIYAKKQRDNKLTTLIIYAYVYYAVLMGFYHYVFDVVFFFYLIIIVFSIYYVKKDRT